jgi:two-component system NtrC family sensor kinase
MGVPAPAATRTAPEALREAAASAPWYRRLLGRAARALTRAVLGRDIVAELRADRERLSADLSRRLGELYSLQQLAHVLSASLRFDEVVAEVARYAMRALDASGAVVLLAPDDGGVLEIVAAKGVLAAHLHRSIDPESEGLVLDAMRHERLELLGGGAPEGLMLFPGARARGAVAAPLRAHGVTVGAIAVADRLVGEFTADDARLLSTAATHAAVVLANARFFELIRVGKEHWEATFDALAEGIALVDAAGGIRRANTAIATMLGRPVTQVIDRHLGEALFGERAGLDALIADAREGRRSAPLVRRSEPLGRILRLTASPLAHPVPESIAVIVVEDITEQKALEGQLIQSEKLAAVGTMVSGVAHELNNPLTSIAGLSEFLLEQARTEEPAKEHLRVINEQAERASRIVRNLLSFARREPTEQGVVDLGDIAQRTVTLMSYELRRGGIEIETEIAPDMPPVIGNRDQLQQVVLNLVTNAAYAARQMPDGAPRRVVVSAAAEGERAVLRVSDSGPGIEPETLAKLFDPFFTTKPPGDGTGLGLFLSYGIAESHGGSLTAESQPGRGASFTLSLPRVPTAGAQASAGTSATGQAVQRVRRILVVDEDAAVRRLVEVLFTHDGHTVDEAADGAEAVRLALGEEYDLLIMDRGAAAGDEPLLTALARLRPGWENRTIVAAAERSSGSSGDPTSGLRMLRKPINLRDLRAAADDVWAAAGPL